jgi:hypothetical protein
MPAHGGESVTVSTGAKGESPPAGRPLGKNGFPLKADGTERKLTKSGKPRGALPGTGGWGRSAKKPVAEQSSSKPAGAEAPAGTHVHDGESSKAAESDTKEETATTVGGKDAKAKRGIIARTVKHVTPPRTQPPAGATAESRPEAKSEERDWTPILILAGGALALVALYALRNHGTQGNGSGASPKKALGEVADVVGQEIEGLLRSGRAMLDDKFQLTFGTVHP